MRSLLAGLLACLILLAPGCGGGGSNGGESNPPAPATNRTDLLFGYYGPVTDIASVADHVNFVWLWDDQVATAMKASAAGVHKLILPLCWQCGPDNWRFLFTGMANSGTLANVIALYPVDEPELAGLSDSAVHDLVKQVRGVAAEFPALAGVQVWVIYSNSGRFPGISSYDAVGIDNYGCNCAPIPPIAPGQRIILIPGGANPWREGPERFEAAANDPRVVAIIPFLWQWPLPEQGLGIRDNGLAPIYRAAGLRLTR